MLHRTNLQQYILSSKRGIVIVKNSRKLKKRVIAKRDNDRKPELSRDGASGYNGLPTNIKDTPFSNSLKDLTNIKNDRELEMKIQELKKFTERIKKNVRDREVDLSKKQLMEEQGSPITKNNKNLELLPSTPTNDFKTKMPEISTPSMSSLYLSPDSKLNILNDKSLVPDFIQEKIQNDMLIYKCLINHRNRTWDPLVEKIYLHENQLSDVPINELRNKFIPNIRNLSFENIEKLDEMLTNVIKTQKYKNGAVPMAFYEVIFKNLSDSGRTMTDQKSFQYVLSYFDKLIERYEKKTEVNSLQNESKSFKFNTLILNHIVSYIFKMKAHSNYKIMNQYLEKFQNSFQVQPNRMVFNTLIAFSIANNNHKQAWDIFDTMKFLSVKNHAPDEYAYVTMINLCNKELDYAKALNLYQELKDMYSQAKMNKKYSSRLPIHFDRSGENQPSIALLSMLAFTMARCSKDAFVAEGKQTSLLLKGWEFIHEIYERTNGMLYQNDDISSKLLVNGEKQFKNSDRSPYQVLKSMMALAAYDGDVSLARALYSKFVSSSVKSASGDKSKILLDPSFLNYLLYAYSRFDIKKVPVLGSYDEGAILRSKIINSCDYNNINDTDGHVNKDVDMTLPYLPKVELTTDQDVLLESRAIWQWHVESLYKKKPSQDVKTVIKNYEADIKYCKEISGDSYETFEKNILVMIDKWRKETAIDFDILNEINLISFLNVPIKLKDLTEFKLRLNKFSVSESDIKSFIKKEFENKNSINEEAGFKNRYEIFSLRHRLLRKNELYLLAMKAACSFKNLEFGQQIWNERGEYRKTDDFKKSVSDVKNKGGQHDELFAKEMCSLFTQLGHLQDAMSIILGSKRYINWKYQDVKPLYQEFINLEDYHSLSILKDVLKQCDKKYDSNLKKLEEQLTDLQI